MKIEEIKQKNKITPVTITLENEGELELMRALAGLIYYSDNTARITNAIVGKDGMIKVSVYFVEKNIDNLYRFLSEHLDKFEL